MSSIYQYRLFRKENARRAWLWWLTPGCIVSTDWNDYNTRIRKILDRHKERYTTCRGHIRKSVHVGTECFYEDNEYLSNNTVPYYAQGSLDGVVTVDGENLWKPKSFYEIYLFIMGWMWNSEERGSLLTLDEKLKDPDWSSWFLSKPPLYQERIGRHYNDVISGTLWCGPDGVFSPEKRTKFDHAEFLARAKAQAEEHG